MGNERTPTTGYPTRPPPGRSKGENTAIVTGDADGKWRTRPGGHHSEWSIVEFFDPGMNGPMLSDRHASTA